MSSSITNAFVQEYSENVYTLAQQKGSKLRNTVTVESGIRGEYAFKDRVGPVTYNVVINRNGDTPLNSTPFSRRRVQLVGRDWGDLVDTLDKVQMLIDPTSATALVAGWTMGRAIDDSIISAFFGTAYANSGLDGTSATTVAFPSANIVAVTDRSFQDEGNSGSGNSNLSVSKLISARNIMAQNNVDLDNERPHIAADATSISGLMGATPVTSIWYNQVKPLVSGEIDNFLGIDFHRTQLVITDGRGNSLLSGGYALLPVWVPSGVYLAIGEDIKARITERPDKRYSYQVYFQMLMGATRLEEAKVVQLTCDPTKPGY